MLICFFILWYDVALPNELKAFVFYVQVGRREREREREGGREGGRERGRGGRGERQRGKMGGGTGAIN